MELQDTYSTDATVAPQWLNSCGKNDSATYRAHNYYHRVIVV